MIDIERVLVGQVIGGNLEKGLRACLFSHDIGLGDHLVIIDDGKIYIAIVSDLEYPKVSSTFLASPLHKSMPSDYQAILDRRFKQQIACLEIKYVLKQGQTITNLMLPKLGASIYHASGHDIEEMLHSTPKESTLIGYLRNGGHDLYLPPHWIQRSTGVFGATGTGKSMFTRQLISSAINSESSSVLVIDLHDEYAFDDVSRESGNPIRGLKSTYANSVAIFGLGGTSVRGNQADYRLEFAFSEITPEDILLLQDELNLTDTASTVLDALLRSFGRDWLHRFLQLDPGSDGSTNKQETMHGWSQKNGVNKLAAGALWSRLQRLNHFPFLVERPVFDGLGTIVDRLLAKKHVVLSFGHFHKSIEYLLVTNILTRRLRLEWEKAAENYRSTQGIAPPQLIIVFEESQNMLGREMASQTTVGKIAREMRKNYISLVIIAQQPSMIDSAIMSQLGTRIAFWMTNPRDIEAVSSGISGANQVKLMINSLAQSQEAVIHGWAMPLPVLFKVRNYG